MRVSANVSMLFGELPLLERFAAAHEAGFRAVELWWPGAEALPAIAAEVRRLGLEVALLNFAEGDLAASDRGLLADPARHEEFLAQAPAALAFAREVGCERLNAMVGVLDASRPRAQHEEAAAAALRRIADSAAEQGAEILIEAINSHDNGPCLVTTTAEAVALIARTGRPNVKLQYDLFHMQRMEGDIANTLRRHRDLLAHVQISDPPDRREPGTGEVSFPFVFALLEEIGYDGYVGLEHRPAGSTLDSLAWIPRELRVAFTAADGLPRAAA